MYKRQAVGLLVWPALLFCQQVYGTLPMLFFVSLALLCYAKYVKTRRRALRLRAAVGFRPPPGFSKRYSR